MSDKEKNGQRCTCFFTHIGNNIWHCKCGQKRKQVLNKGFDNLKLHIKTDHPVWKEEFLASQKQCKLFLNLEPVASAKAQNNQNNYGWMEMIIMKNVPFNFCEDPLIEKYSKLNSIDSDTFT